MTSTTHSSSVPTARSGYGASFRRLSTETKAAFKTTELVAYLAAVVAVIVTATLVGTDKLHVDYFRADKAMFYIVLLTIAYLGSRGLAKSGSRDYYTEDVGDAQHFDR